MPPTPPGRRDALLRPAPLRTVRASRRCTRLKQTPWGDSGIQNYWFLAGAGCPSLAVGVNETGVVRRAVYPVGDDVLSGEVRAVDHRPRPVQRAGTVELGEQLFVQALPYPGVVPVPQPPPTGHTGAEAQLLGQELPLNGRVQHEQDAAQRFAVIQSRTTRMTGVALDNRQQRLDTSPQLVGHDPGWLLTLPHALINNPGDQAIPSFLLGVLSLIFKSFCPFW